MILIGVIFLFKRLHLPRNLSWIGIGISNIFHIGANLVVSVSVRLGSITSSARALSIWFSALSNATLTWNILFALLERHVCINYPRWHKRLFTNISIPIIQSCSFVLLFLVFGMTKLQVFQELFLDQFFSSRNFKLLGTLFIGMLPFLLAGQLAFMATKTQQSYPVAETIKVQQVVRPNNGQQHNDDEAADPYDDDETDNKEQQAASHFVTIGKNRISRLELEAYRTIYLIGIIYFTLMVLIFISFVLVFVCIRWRESPSECSPFVQGFYYSINLLHCLHSSIVNPLAFGLLSKDFSSIFRSRWSHLNIKDNTITHQEQQNGNL